ncbi:glycosyltransferase [Oribacterium sp. WCC10]|uniref:glycosyltransferase n=1 Tax=Oribacterium sp. WCC10 TaxID=1855343 RepID=UPI0008E4FEF6|nr:glycosyltransferase [Oribacterium sp. WCC10]SFG24333.1 Glycosyl transferase family 2 [Oribacterium sp. WCC10]
MIVNLVMIVKNEERCLERCLTAARPFVDNIIIADSGSTDKTPEIAKKFDAKVYDFPWVNDFSEARNFALGHSERDWNADINLVLDADEYLIEDEKCNPKALRDFIDHMYDKSGLRWLGTILREDSYPNGDEIDRSITEIARILPVGMRYRGSIHEQVNAKVVNKRSPLYALHDGYMQHGKGERNLQYLEEALKQDPDYPYYNYQMALTLRNLDRKEESLPYFRVFFRNSGKKEIRQEQYWSDGIMRYLYTLYDIGTEKSMEEAHDVMGKVQYDFTRNPDFYFFSGLFYMKLILIDTKKNQELLPYIEKSYLKCLSLGEISRPEGVIGTGSFKAAYNLGTWYEVSGNIEKAREYYQMAADEGYSKAVERLKSL